MASESDIVAQALEQVATLVYELLDAHADTAALADELGQDSRWGAHVDYLRNLQRVGRETLARLSEIEAGRAADGVGSDI
jgi:hypothetical protein